MLKTAVLFFFGLVLSASAIVVQTNSVAETDPAGLDWSHVHEYKGGSGVAVGGHWLLTAAHVAHEEGSGIISIGETSYFQQEIVFNNEADLALIRYDKVLPGHYGLFTGTLVPDEPESKLDVLMVGFGNTGTVAPNGWTDGGSGSGTRRWGSQTLSFDGTYRTTPDGVVNVTTIGAYMLYNLGDTNHEAGAGAGDSGGGVFYHDGSSWKLAGIMIGRTDSGSAFTSTFAASVPEYAGWINATIPEPAAVSLLGISTLSMLITRSLLRHKLSFRRTYCCDAYEGTKVSRTPGDGSYVERWFKER